MEKNKRVMFALHIMRQCDFALSALSEMELFLQTPNNNINPFWYYVDMFLLSTGNISKAFWPSAARDTKYNELVEQRGKELREMFKISEDSPLRARSVRNDFEHYDERIDVLFATTDSHIIADSSIISEGSLNTKSKIHYVRVFDPKTHKLLFFDNELDVVEVGNALIALRNQFKDIPELKYLS